MLRGWLTSSARQKVDDAAREQEIVGLQVVGVGQAVGDAEQVASALGRPRLDLRQIGEGAKAGIVHQQQALKVRHIAQARDAVAEGAEIMAPVPAMHDFAHQRPDGAGEFRCEPGRIRDEDHPPPCAGQRP